MVNLSERRPLVINLAVWGKFLLPSWMLKAPWNFYSYHMERDNGLRTQFNSKVYLESVGINVFVPDSTIPLKSAEQLLKIWSLLKRTSILNSAREK